VVTQNNIQALIRQGTRIPIVTQAQLGGPPTVTLYRCLPQVDGHTTDHGGKTRSLDMWTWKTPFLTSAVCSGSQLNPTLEHAAGNHQVLVSDGGTVLIGGVIQTQNSVSYRASSVWAHSSSGNLFKHTNVNTSNAELNFFITPKIIQT